MKPGARKVLFTCMKRNDKREVKVAQLAGSVAEMSAYHHGEVCSKFSLLCCFYYFLVLTGVAIYRGFLNALINKKSYATVLTKKTWFDLFILKCSIIILIYKKKKLSGTDLWQEIVYFLQQALMMTIVNLAQNFVGSNNINILQPLGQFGTRINGGKDAASPRYIFTMLR